MNEGGNKFAVRDLYCNICGNGGRSGICIFRAGIKYRKSQAEAAIGSAEKEAERIIEAAKEEADSKKKIALVEAKDEIHKSRTELERRSRSAGTSLPVRNAVSSRRKKTLTRRMTPLKRRTISSRKS